MNKSDFLIPPHRLQTSDAVFRWPERTVVALSRMPDLVPLQQLKDDLRSKLRRRVDIRKGAGGAAHLRIHRCGNIEGIDGYRLKVGPDGIDLHTASDAGAYYGLQLLREMITLHGDRLPACRIVDFADFARRGVYLDCSRGKVPTLATLRDLIERLAAWRINELQLYVENVFAFRKHPDIPRDFSPLTPEELLELQEHGKRHHVQLVPSLASFGHMETILALPKYRTLAELPGTHGFPGGTTLCPTDPRSIRLMRDLYNEFVPLFEAVNFNICGDETWELGKGRSKEAADKEGVSHVYLDFIGRLHELVSGHGKRMNLWADIVLNHPEDLNRVPADVCLLNWDYAARGQRFRYCRAIEEAGLPFMVCTGTSSWQRHGTDIENAIQNVSHFVRLARKHHAEGVLNTDWGDSGHRNALGVSLHGYAHGAAHSWNGRAVDDDRFTAAFCRHVFGCDDSQLADSIRTLGRAAPTSGTLLYHALVEPIQGDRRRFLQGISQRSPVRMGHAKPRDDIARASEEGLESVIDGLAAPGLWPSAPDGLASFERIALLEYELAARMDVLAACRSLLARAVRDGETPSRKTCRELSTRMRQTTRDFQTLWIARNKPSRLADNVKLLQRAADEVHDLA